MLYTPVNYGIRIWIIYGRDETNTEISAHAMEFLECREINAHVHAVCTRPSSSPPRGRPGNEASVIVTVQIVGTLESSCSARTNISTCRVQQKCMYVFACICKGFIGKLLALIPWWLHIREANKSQKFAPFSLPV